MTLVCFASFKGSPGTTLTALATAAALPTGGTRQKLLLEADPDGGALALRYQMPTKPGLISLAAAARRGLSKDQIWDHAQELPGGLPVVLGPEGPEQATEVLRGNGRELGEWLSSLPDVDVIADVGRLSIGSPAFDFVRAADAVLGVVRPTAVELQPGAQRMVALSNFGLRVGWVLIGQKPYSANDVSRAYGLPVVHVVEEDARGAQYMESGSNPNKLRRSTLVRSIAGLADTLADWLHPAVSDEWSPPNAGDQKQPPTPPPSANPMPAPTPTPTPTAAPATPGVAAPPPSPDSRVDAPQAPTPAHSTPAAPAPATPQPDPSQVVPPSLTEPPVTDPPFAAVDPTAPLPMSSTAQAPPAASVPEPAASSVPEPAASSVPEPGATPADQLPPPPPQHKAAGASNLPGLESGTPSLAILAAQRGQEVAGKHRRSKAAKNGKHPENGNGDKR